jgi:hypothetical protein
MQLEYLLVTYSSSQTVCADGTSIGVTNEILLLAAGDHTISLSGVTTVPPSVDITLNDTTEDQPQVVAFT